MAQAAGPSASPGPGLPPELPPGIQEVLRQSGAFTGTIPGPRPGGPTHGVSGAAPGEPDLQEFLDLKLDRRPAEMLQALADQADARALSPTNASQRLKRAVETGDWAGVRLVLAALPAHQVDPVYSHLLKTVGKAGAPGSGEPGMPPGVLMGGPPPPEAFLQLEDVLALSEVKPGSLSDTEVEALGALLGRCLPRGGRVEPVLKRLEAGTRWFGSGSREARDRTAVLLVAAGRLTEAGPYLRPVEAALAAGDLPALDVQARYLAAVGREDGRAAATEQAWNLNLRLLAATNAAPGLQASALTRTLELFPQIGAQLGTNWLGDTFRARPDQALRVLSSLAAQATRDARQPDLERRRLNLELQRRFVDVLLGTGLGEEERWRLPLRLLAAVWLPEAEQARDRHRPRRSNGFPQFDPFGNQVFPPDGFDPGMGGHPNLPPALAVAQVLPTAPGEGWLRRLDDLLAIRVRTVVVELHLKNEDEQQALPGIEALAVVEPGLAGRLANELLRSWARSHDPNPPNPNPGMNMYPRYMSGGMPAPAGIPLTRALQTRYLEELSALLARLRKMSLPPLEDGAVVGAFTAAHSQAEVFRLEDIQAVFGPVSALEPGVLAELLQTMRQRLAGQWRQARVQQDARTKRTDREVEAEVLRGYEVVSGLAARAVDRQPDDWRLLAVQASLAFDHAEFEYGRQVDLREYTTRRDAAFAGFRQAAARYADRVLARPEGEQTPEVFQRWFNATLGASDLAYLTRQSEPDTNHLGRLRDTLLALPGAVRERHVAAFGRGLAESAATLKPELKLRYLRAGLRVLGDHPGFAEARRTLEHYEDLLGEVSLDARLDGPTEVGHGRPFGVFLALRYTEAVGREGGGFNKYLQNQQGQGFYFNPYGTPPVNYREDFEKGLKERWSPGFEILSVTFHDEKVQPRGYGRAGWRETPYAYVLLQARDPAVDRLPPLQLDLDFFDRRGPVILPVQSPLVLLDARGEGAPPRPAARLAATVVLDDREAGGGRLTLDLKVTGQGVVPELGELFDLRFPDFRMTSTNEPALSVLRVEVDDGAVAAVTERTWLVTLESAARAGTPVFRFPAVRREGMAVAYRRYQDADLVEVPAATVVAGVSLRPRSRWPWAAGLGAVAGLAAGGWWVRRHRAPAAPGPGPRHRMPAVVTPFSVVQLLRRLEADPALSWTDDQRTEMARSIREIEARHFSPEGGATPAEDPEDVARRWVARAS